MRAYAMPPYVIAFGIFIRKLIQHEFLRQSEERDERAKRLLLCSTFNHASEIIDLRDQPFRLPDEPRINVLEERFAEIEERILEFC